MKLLFSGFLYLLCIAVADAKNVVVIIIDDATEQHIKAAMPSFEKNIAVMGVTYTSAIFDNALCSPSSANFLTGKIGRITGMVSCDTNPLLENASNEIIQGNNVTDNGKIGTAYPSSIGTFDFRETLFTEMHKAGYKVGYFGKYLNGYAGDYINNIHYTKLDSHSWKYYGQFAYQPVPPGVDTWRVEYGWSTGENFSYNIYSADGSSVGIDNKWLADQGYDFENKKAEPIEYFKHEVKNFLDRNSGSKFLTLRLHNPHYAQFRGKLPYIGNCHYKQPLPYVSLARRGTIDPLSLPLPDNLIKFLNTVSNRREEKPDDGMVTFPCPLQDGMNHRGMYEMYYRYATASIQEALMDYDELVDLVIRHLRETGQYNDTLFMLFNDNGMMNGERGLYNKNKPWREASQMYLVIKYPNQNTSKIVRHHITNTYIAPTILDVMGVETGMKMHASSLVNIERRRLHKKHLLEGYVKMCHKWKYEGVSNGRWKYFIEYNSDNPPVEYFFDTDNDSNETVNLIHNPGLSNKIGLYRDYLRSFPGGPMHDVANIESYRNNCN